MCSLSVAVVSVESREAHLNMLVLEAERRVTDLAAQAQRDGRSLEACQKDKQLRTWEWRTNLYKRMKMGFQHARETPPTQTHCSHVTIVYLLALPLFTVMRVFRMNCDTSSNVTLCISFLNFSLEITESSYSFE